MRRREFVAAASCLGLISAMPASVSGEDVPSSARVILPRGRVPLSFIIDDSTCLVNMGHFCMPQFAEAWPERDIYKQPWNQWPREIPDSFVREFGEWCSGAGVKGKYSIVPYPACVGWLDRGLPGWSRKQLDDSLALVRDLMLPNWDIHPEMITHTRVIDLKTGRPMQTATAATMENSYPQTDISVDHLTEYLAYALRVLKNCGLPCEGITTPGGFGNRVKAKLPIAVHQAVRDVFGTDLPHYFKYVVSGNESAEPKLEYVSDSNRISDLTMNVPAGTGDWFGGWEGTQNVEADRYCNAEATSGRMVELIERGDPAVMLCHWPGMYCNGAKTGFKAFQRIVTSIQSRFEKQTQWMKVSEIGRYWAAKETTTFSQDESGLQIHASIKCRDFTFEFGAEVERCSFVEGANQVPLRRVDRLDQLAEGRFVSREGKTTVCVELSTGTSVLTLGGKD
ncbi:MAG: hypothetical protein AAFX06_19895 [Planctomycetota bacterium]